MPFSIFGISKQSTFRQPVAPSKSIRSSTVIGGWRTLTAPAFPEIIVITVPLVPTGFCQIILGMEIRSFSVYVLFFFVPFVV